MLASGLLYSANTELRKGEPRSGRLLPDSGAAHAGRVDQGKEVVEYRPEYRPAYDAVIHRGTGRSQLTAKGATDLQHDIPGRIRRTEGENSASDAYQANHF